MTECYTKWDPTAREDGMVRCPRKAGSAIATGRCEAMRGEECGECPGRKQTAPKQERTTSSYTIQFPYTEGCSLAGHHSTKTGMACQSCAAARVINIHPAPVCAYFHKSSTRLYICPCGRSEAKVKRHGCPWQRDRKPAYGKMFIVCVFRPDHPGEAEGAR